MKTKFILAVFLFICATSCTKKSTDPIIEPDQSTANLLKVASYYGIPQSDLKISGKIEAMSDEQLNEMFIATKLHSLFVKGYNRNDAMKLAEKIQQALDNGTIHPSNVVMTFVKNAHKNVTGYQMFVGLRKSMQLNKSAASHEDGGGGSGCTDCTLEEVILYADYPPNGFGNYYFYLQLAAMSPIDGPQGPGGGGDGGGSGGEAPPPPPPPPPTVSVTPDTATLAGGLKQIYAVSTKTFLFATLKVTFVLNPDRTLNSNSSGFNVKAEVEGSWVGKWEQGTTVNPYVSGDETTFTLNGKFVYGVPGTPMSVSDSYSFYVTYNAVTNTVYITKNNN